RRPAHLRPPEPYALAGFLRLDGATRRNLELLETLGGERRGALLWVLDQTETPMGARRLREWVLYPLLEPAAIGRRLDAVEGLVEAVGLRAALRAGLAGIGDLERLGGRVGARTAGPRDLAHLGVALGRVAELRAMLGAARAEALVTLAAALDPLPEAAAEIARTLVDAPPPHTRLPGFIRAGRDPEVDELRESTRDGKGWPARFEAAERGPGRPLRARRGGPSAGLRPAADQRGPGAAHPRGSPPRGRSSRGYPIRAERHGARPRRRTDPPRHRAEHGRQVDLPPPGRAHRAARADGQLRAGGGGRDRARRSHLHARRRQRQPGGRRIDVHGRDARDG